MVQEGNGGPYLHHIDVKCVGRVLGGEGCLLVVHGRDKVSVKMEGM